MRRRAARNVVMRHGELVAPQAGDVLVTAAVGPAGDAVALWATPEDAAALHGRHENAGGASFPDVTLPQPVEVRATVHTASRVTQLISIGELSLAHPHVQPMPEGELLIVGEYACSHGGDQCPNALELRRDLDRARNHIGNDIRAMRYSDHRKVAHAAEQAIRAQWPIQASEQLIG